MPAAVEKAVSDVGNLVGEALPVIGAVVGFIYGGPTGASIGYSLGKAGQGAIKGNSNSTSGFVASAEGRDQVIRSSVANRTFIYGSAMVSGPLVFGGVAGEGNKYLWLVIPVAGHEVDAIPVVQFNELEVPLDASGNVTSGPYAGKVLVKKHLGNAGDPADVDLVAAGIGWTADHRLAGVAYLAVRLEWSRDVFPAGIPNIKAVVRGRKVFDPRSGLTVWSQNPALCVRDYITSTHGLEASASEIDTALLVAAANVCDEPITLAGGGTEPRYTCNGVLDTGSTPREIMEGMLTSMAGFVVWSGGQYQIHAGAYTAPTVTLTADDLRGPVKVRPRMSRKELFNAVRGTFVDPSAYWQPTDFPVVSNATYAEQDGGQVIWRDSVLPYTTSSATAQRIAKITLERSRQGITVELACKLTVFKVSTMSTVRLEIEQLGWAGKEFKVLGWHFAPEGGVDLVLQEEVAASYEWNSGLETVRDPAPDTNLPDPLSVAPPTGLSVEVQNITQPDGVVAPRLVASWFAAADAFVREYEVAWREDAGPWDSATTSALRWLIPGAVTGSSYDVRVRSINSLGVKSAWLTKDGTVSTPPQAAPAAPVLTALGSMFAVRLDWAFGDTRKDIAGVEVWHSVTNNRAAAQRLALVPFAATSYSHTGLSAGQGGYYWGRAVDTHDNASSWYPAGAAAGLFAAASSDPSALLEQLRGSVGIDQIAADLAQPIASQAQSILDLIESVEAIGTSVQQEATTRANADGSLAQQIITVQAVLSQSNLGKPLPLWNLNGQSIVTLADGKVGSAALRLSGNGGYPNQGYLVAIDRSKQYRTRFWARPSADTEGFLHFSLQQFVDGLGSPGPVNGGRSPYKPSGVSRSLHDTTYGAGQWGEYSFVWAASDWQAGVAFVLPEFLNNYPSAAGHWDIQDFTFTEVTAIENLSAAVQSEATARANADSAIAGTVTTLQARVDGVEGAANAAVQSEAAARANADSAIAGTVNTVLARLDTGDYAAVKESASATASRLGGVEAKYVLQVDANGRVAGMQLASGSGGTSVVFLADKFAFVMPDGSGAPRQVFVVGNVNGTPTLGFDGNQVVDGSIVARSLAAGTITAESGVLANAAIKSANIDSLAVNSIHIVGEAVTTSRFGSANGFERYWGGVPISGAPYSVEDVYSTLTLPVRAGEQTLITVSYVEIMSGSYTTYDYETGAPTTSSAVVYREPRIRVNGGAALATSGPHGCVRVLYVAPADGSVQVNFSVFVQGRGDGAYRASTLIMSAFTARR